MKIIVIAERHSPDGTHFRTSHVLDHISVQFTLGAAGWQGEGAGLSTQDFARIAKELGAVNVHSFQVFLTD